MTLDYLKIYSLEPWKGPTWWPSYEVHIASDTGNSWRSWTMTSRKVFFCPKELSGAYIMIPNYGQSRP